MQTVADYYLVWEHGNYLSVSADDVAKMPKTMASEIRLLSLATRAVDAVEIDLTPEIDRHGNRDCHKAKIIPSTLWKYGMSYADI